MKAEHDAGHAQPPAPPQPATDPKGSERKSQKEERKREEHGNRGPDEEPGFGQGA